MGSITRTLHLSGRLPRRTMGASSITFIANALFLGFFGLQFLLAPDFLMSENFLPGSYKLDKWHYFIMQGCGCSFLSLAAFYFQMSSQADNFMLTSLLTFTLTSCALPFYAQMKMPVAIPKHMIPVGGCVVPILAQLFCLINPEKKDKKK